MKRIFPIMSALVPVLWLSTVSALGLGEIDVRSRLNQRFVASIPLSALAADEAESVRVALASNAEFDRAGIERGDYLSTLTFNVVNDGNPRIEISSSQVVREPFLNFLLSVNASSGRLLREYTVLLDPPGVGAAPESARPIPVPAPAPVSSPSEFYQTAEEAKRPVVSASAPAASKPAPALTPVPAASGAAAPAPVAAPTALGEGEYGPVQSGETFWSIASRLRPEAGVTMDQMLLAIYENNRESFDGGINGLRRGAVLKVPSPDSIRAVSPAAAKAEVARLRGLPAQRPAPQATTPEVSAPAAAPAPAPISVKPIMTPAPDAGKQAPAAAPEAPISESSQPPPSDLGTPPEEAYASTPATGDEAAAGSEVQTAGAEDAVVSVEQGDDATASTEPAENSATPVPVPEPAVQSGGESSEPSLLEALLLPLLGGLLVLGGVGYLVSKVLAKRRGAAPAIATTTVTRPKAVAAAAAAVVAKPSAPAAAVPAERTLSTKEQLEQIQESFDDTLEASASSPGTKTESLDTQQLATQQIKTQQIAADDLDSAAATQMFETPPAASPPTDAVDFDLTGQFESQTVQINLDANDPLSEADFHLAYGLYDEAALLLKQAAAKEPGRSDVQVKLAETYFAAGKVAEFRETAESLRPKLSAADWQKLAIMGQQLEPGADIYQSDAGSADVAMDMSFDDLATPPTATPPPSTAAEKAPAEPPPALPTGLDEGLDFKLEDLELSTLDQDEGLQLAKSKDNALEFDLGDFDTPKPAAEPAPAAPSAAPAGNEMEFDLGQFDEPAMSEPEAAAAPEAPATMGAEQAAEAEAELEDVGADFDFGEMPADSSTISGDEAGTKLDLARAYVDMGDDEMARSLLGEVMEQGNDAQKQDAKALIARLG